MANTPNLKPQNYYSTTLSSSVNTTDTVFPLNGAVPTNSEGYLEIDEGLSSREIIFFTSVGANSVTAPSVGAGRGVGGTSAASHASGATVKMKLNAEWYLALQNGQAIANNAIQAASLATNAITLGYAQITAAVVLTTPTSDTLVTGLTTGSITIPAGGRKVKITAWANAIDNSGTSAVNTLSIWDGTVGSGTELATALHSSTTVASDPHQVTAIAVVTPAAGSKTYNVGIKASAGNCAVGLTVGSTPCAFILVEAI